MITPLRRHAAPLLALAALAAPALAAPALAQEYPKLPPVQLEGFTQTAATSFEDLTGRALMLDFFAYWCGPCAASVPHVNDLQEKWGPRGLTVLGLTDEEPEKTEPWVERHGMEYAYAYDKGGLGQRLGVNSIPRAVVVDVHGNILYNGHPSGVTEDLLEKAVKGAFPTPMWEWGPAGKGVREALRKGELGAAVGLAASMTAEDGGPAIHAVLEGMVATRLGDMRAARERGDHLGTLEAAERLVTELKGLPGAAEAEGVVANLRGDADAQKLIAVQREVAEYRTRRYRSKEQVEEAIAAVEKLVAAHPGTYVEVEGQLLLKGLGRLIGRR